MNVTASGASFTDSEMRDIDLLQRILFAPTLAQLEAEVAADDTASDLDDSDASTVQYMSNFDNLEFDY